MVDLNTGRTALKRGGFARDKRTGQVVKITEQGGRDWMVKAAYKSDGYWVGPENLESTRDPHLWTGWHLVRFLAALGLALYCAYGMWTSLDGDPASVFSASFCTGSFALVAAAKLFGVSRI